MKSAENRRHVVDKLKNMFKNCKNFNQDLSLSLEKMATSITIKQSAIELLKIKAENHSLKVEMF